MDQALWKNRSIIPLTFEVPYLTAASTNPHLGLFRNIGISPESRMKFIENILILQKK
jgi:hypothetical protein